MVEQSVSFWFCVMVRAFYFTHTHEKKQWIFCFKKIYYLLLSYTLVTYKEGKIVGVNGKKKYIEWGFLFKKKRKGMGIQVIYKKIK